MIDGGVKTADVFWTLFIAWSLVLFGTVSPASAKTEKVTVKLVSGETMTGTVGSVRDGSLSLITDYGPVRIPVDKLTAETRIKLGVTDKVDIASLQKRITELEDLVARLREENANLRKAGTPAVPAAPQPLVTPGASSGTRSGNSVAPAASGMGYKLSSTGKRHNSRCRYFSSAGRACGPSDGVACKICGG